MHTEGKMHFFFSFGRSWYTYRLASPCESPEVPIRNGLLLHAEDFFLFDRGLTGGRSIQEERNTADTRSSLPDRTRSELTGLSSSMT
ncbi:hypothetical protein EMPS_00500 [Entomortierella parvispora]|uniref:Uncharacterized protein n=1 Tax=Entomortierella parvispora TaxID=205924 RepID=A0A9P3LRS9_9FUNG|nr:hypothetical protein EMPS_00500 [Entomortierella parvispora]